MGTIFVIIGQWMNKAFQKKNFFFSPTKNKTFQVQNDAFNAKKTV